MDRSYHRQRSRTGIVTGSRTQRWTNVKDFFVHNFRSKYSYYTIYQLSCHVVEISTELLSRSLVKHLQGFENVDYQTGEPPCRELYQEPL